MRDAFLEIVIKADEAAEIGIEARDEIEEPLEEALAASGLGEVTGGGGGSGLYIVDVELPDDEQLEAALSVIRGVLRELKVPPSTRIEMRQPEERTFEVYG